jgi:hypothetical protein
MVRLAVVAVLAALLAPAAAASLAVAENAARPSLRIDAGGNAEIA